jgi:hypothetical protein
VTLTVKRPKTLRRQFGKFYDGKKVRNTYDQSAAIRLRITMGVRSNVRKPYDGSSASFTMAKKFVTTDPDECAKNQFSSQGRRPIFKPIAANEIDNNSKGDADTPNNNWCSPLSGLLICCHPDQFTLF